MAYNLGTARGVIDILYNPRGVKQADKDIKTLGDSSASSSKKMQSAGNVMGVAGAGIAAGLLVAVDQAAKFEQRVDVIGAVSGRTGDIMDSVREKALALGESTVFGATEVADAMGELVKAGLSVEEVLGGAADATVALAAAGEIDLAKAAIISANAMNQFNLEAKDMPKVADLIAGAANASAINVHQFGLSLSQVGAVANLVGFTFDDTARAIAVLGDAGIRGSDAGTSLKTMFINLVPQTKPAIRLFEELGLSQFSTARAMDLLRKNGIKPVGNDMASLNKQIVALSVKQSGSAVGTAKQTKVYAQLTSQMGVMANQFFDAQGKVKPMNEVFGILANSMKNLTKEQQIASLSTIFGTDAIRASAIAAQLSSGGFNKMAGEMAKVTAEAVAAERLNNLRGDIEKLKGSLQTTAINLGTVLIPALRDLTQDINGLISWFNKLDESTQSTIVKTLAWTAGILLMGAIIIKVVGIISTFVGWMKLAAASKLAQTLLLNGKMALLMAKGALAAGAAWLRAAAASTLFWARVVAQYVAMQIASAATVVYTAVTSALSLANLRAAASWVASTVAAVAHRAAMVAGVAITWVMVAAQAALSAVMNANPISLIIIAIVALVAALVLAYKKSETFRNIVDAVWRFIKTAVTTYINAVKTVIVAVWNFIAAAFKFYFNLYKTIAVSVWNFISRIIQANITIIRSIISAVVSFVLSRWNALKSVASMAATFFGNVVAAIRAKISAAVAAVTGIVNGILAKFTGLRDALVGAGRDLIQGLINGISGMFGAVMDKARSLADSVKNTIKNALKISSPSKVMDLEVGVQIGAGMIAGMERMRGRLADAAASLAQVPVTAAVGAGVGAFPGALSPAGFAGGPGVVFEKGSIAVTALPGMSTEQVGEFTARKLGTALSTRTQAPRIATGR